MATVDVDASKKILDMSKEIMNKGIKKKDSLHIACAIKAGCEYFLTTDKKLLNKNLIKKPRTPVTLVMG